MAFDIDMIKGVYANIAERVDKAREIVGRPLTLSEKILYSHLWDGIPTRELKGARIMLILHRTVWPCRMPRHKWPYCSSCRPATQSGCTYHSPLRPPDQAKVRAEADLQRAVNRKQRSL